MSVENSGVRFHAERNFPAKKSRMMPGQQEQRAGEHDADAAAADKQNQPLFKRQRVRSGNAGGFALRRGGFLAGIQRQRLKLGRAGGHIVQQGKRLLGGEAASIGGRL